MPGTMIKGPGGGPKKVELIIQLLTIVEILLLIRLTLSLQNSVRSMQDNNGNHISEENRDNNLL